MGCARPMQLPCQFRGRTRAVLWRINGRHVNKPSATNNASLLSLRKPFRIAPAVRTFINIAISPGNGIITVRSAIDPWIDLPFGLYDCELDKSADVQLMRMIFFRAQILWDLGRCILRATGKVWDFVTAKKSVIEEVEDDIEEVAKYAKKTAIKVEKVAKTVEEVADYVEEGADKLESIIEKLQKGKETIEEEVDEALSEMEKSQETLGKVVKKKKDSKGAIG
ncbi:hypothetical protein GOP47_0014816 [Adiantum capillus-veneris]|uniref:Uncharacterized protein n=1 Tax=Adiantum capillus-veneris TaxID=13818 RepID=A0A9D4UNG0_ADICA|nr:hypothetical protein GOP47_0014816 [Adiantum capillus-veneris]